VDVEGKKGVWVRGKFQEMTGKFSKLSSKWKKEKSYLDNVSEIQPMQVSDTNTFLYSSQGRIKANLCPKHWPTLVPRTFHWHNVLKKTMYINAKILNTIRKIYYKFKMLRKNVSI
jgi:hypothetical protein